MKRLFSAVGVVAMIAIAFGLLVGGTSALADSKNQQGAVGYSTAKAIELNQHAGNLDCSFGTISPVTGETPACSPQGSLKAKSNASYIIAVGYTAGAGSSYLRVKVDSTLLNDGGSTSSYTATGESGRIHPVQYQLANLFDAPIGDFSITVTFTATTQ